MNGTAYLASKMEIGERGYCPAYDEYVEVVELEGQRMVINVEPFETDVVIIDDLND